MQGSEELDSGLGEDLELGALERGAWNGNESEFDRSGVGIREQLTGVGDAFDGGERHGALCGGRVGAGGVHLWRPL